MAVFHSTPLACQQPCGGPRDVPRHHAPDARLPHHNHSESPQKPTGVFSLERYLGSRILLWQCTCPDAQEPSPLGHDRFWWRKLVTEPPLKLGKPFVRQPRGDIWETTEEDKQRWLNSARPSSPSGARKSALPTTEEIT